jgi:beta-lactamase class A
MRTLKGKWPTVLVTVVGTLTLVLVGLFFVREYFLPCSAYLNRDVPCIAKEAQIVFSRDLRKSVNDKIIAFTQAGSISTASVYYQSLDSDQWFSISNGLYQPASLSKVPLMMWYYSLAESDPSILERRIHYDEAGVSLPQHFSYGGIAPGNSYTVEELIKSMIVNSDNNAAQALISMLSPDDRISLFADFDYRKTSSTSPEYRSDVKTIASQYRMLYDASYLTPKDSEHALKLLSQTKFTKGLAAGVPHTTRVSDKFGERTADDGVSKQIHDCGIVYAPNNPYVLCVMTRGSDPDVLASVIADISHLVYAKVEGGGKRP